MNKIIKATWLILVFPLCLMAQDKPTRSGVQIGFSEGFSPKKVNGKWGYEDTDGNLKIPASFDKAWSFNGGLSPVEKNGKWGFINVTGKEVIPLIYDHVWPFIEGYAHVDLNGRLLYINKSGQKCKQALQRT